MINHPFKPDENDKNKVKRNMALTSMGMLFSIVLGVFYLIKTGDTQTAAMLTAGSGIITISLPTLAAPIIHYFHLIGKNDDSTSR